MSWLDSGVAACLVPLALWIVITGLDDLALDVTCLWVWLRTRLAGAPDVRSPGREELLRCPEKPIAIFVPLWREDAVIGRMLEHNLAAIHYRNYEVFLGAYPNDPPTLAAVEEARQRFPRVHSVVCPHDGPTSKADCLNWIYQGLLIEEEQRGVCFKVVVLHDAEDLIHPEALRWINCLADRYDMIQIPVLPLPTPLIRLTHGVYCDEFAEFQSRDLLVRQALGGFLPSCGVGVGYSRRAVERLAGAASNRVFDPGCLTEDYEVGLRLRKLGCSQIFVPIRFLNGHPLATREFFPDRFRTALRQRTRWVVGIALQNWQKYGWNHRQAYWFWRDRKGLVGHPAGCLVNLLFIYGLATWLLSRWWGVSWGLAEAAADLDSHGLFDATLFLMMLRLGVRAGCVARVYGWRFALAVPMRVVWANWLNGAATVSALARYLEARWGRRPLVWLKTEHQYPSREALLRHKRPLDEVLVGSGYLEAERLAAVVPSQLSEERLGEYLVRIGLLSEEQLYEALSLQQNVPFTRLEPDQVHQSAARALPADLARQWNVVPFRLEPGALHVAGAGPPSEEQERALRAVTDLEIRYYLITPANLAALTQQSP